MVKSLFPKKISPFLGDILSTSIVAVVVAICNVFVIRIIGKGLGAEELGIYTLVRRTVATVLPFSSLSIGIGLARYIALYAGKGQKTESILPVAVALSSVTSLMVCLALLAFSGSLSELIFNEKGRELLIILILFHLFGENLFICLYAFYRGQQRMFQANIWGMHVLGILPVLLSIVFIHMNNVNYIVFGIGVLFYLSLFSLLPKIIDGIRRTNYGECKTIAIQLLDYSIPRAPGGVALMLIFTFGVLVSPHTGGIANAAYMSIGIWIFQILQTATDSFGQVVLPKAASYLGSGNEEYLVSKLRSIYDFILHVGLFTVIQLFLLLDFLIFIWLGAEYSKAVPIARIIILSMLPFFFFTMMRNIIDAVEKKAINAFNLYISLIITIAISLLLIKSGLGLSALAIGLTSGFLSLGVFTYIYMFRRYRISLISDNFKLIIFVNILMGLGIYLMKYKMMSNHFNYINFVIIVSAQIVCGMLYLLILKKSGTTWITDIEDRISNLIT